MKHGGDDKQRDRVRELERDMLNAACWEGERDRGRRISKEADRQRESSRDELSVSSRYSPSCCLTLSISCFLPFYLSLLLSLSSLPPSLPLSHLSLFIFSLSLSLSLYLSLSFMSTSAAPQESTTSKKCSLSLACAWAWACHDYFSNEETWWLHILEKCPETAHEHAMRQRKNHEDTKMMHAA